MAVPAETRRSLRPKREDVFAACLVLLMLVGVAVGGGLFLIETQFRPGGSAFGLPTRIPACGRSFTGPGRVSTLAEIEAGMTTGHAPIVLEPTIGEIPLLAPFEPHTVPTGMTTCDVVIFLRVGPDAYVGYALEGGP